MYLSAWDFAGQHIEHATHQFFLTENAVYLILWNARLGAESGRRDLWYWLDLLRMRVRNARFLLVATHSEHTPADLNLVEIEREYPGCQGNFAVDLDGLKGFPALEARIHGLAAESPSLRAAWPKDWIPVREKIRQIRKEQHYVTPEQLRSLMSQSKIIKTEDQDDLAHQLHELGEIVYFRDREALSRLVVLDPVWVSELIAQVVRSEVVREHNGILRTQDLEALWQSARLDSSVRNHLVNLMDAFDLTYATDDPTDIGVVVEALAYAKPEEVTPLPEGAPRMEMIFRFPSAQRHLPPGIPTWTIARAHRYRAGEPRRDAAAFFDVETNSHAQIQASDIRKEVRLSVAADYPPFFFGVMEAILRDTFRRYPGAQPERRFPCNHAQGCTHSFLYDAVMDRRRKGKLDITCESGADVTIESLLAGVREPTSDQGQLALQASIRRMFNEQLDKPCPGVFTLEPARGFTQLATAFEALTQDDELELTLYCEHEKDWHPTEHSIYRFRPEQDWVDQIKQHSQAIAAVTKVVHKLVVAVPETPALAANPTGKLARALGDRDRETPQEIELEVRYLLERLLKHLDSLRKPDQPPSGGLLPQLVEDGRLLWLCPKHKKLYLGRR
jgi:internalin A